MVPLALTAGTFAATWWYVVVYNAPQLETVAVAEPTAAAVTTALPTPPAPPPGAAGLGPAEENRRSSAGGSHRRGAREPRGAADAPPEEMRLGHRIGSDEGRKGARAILPVVLGMAAFSALVLVFTTGGWTARSSRSSRS